MAGVPTPTISSTALSGKGGGVGSNDVAARRNSSCFEAVLYIYDRSGNTEPNMLLRTQLVLHSEGILNSPLWGPVYPSPLASPRPCSALLHTSLSIRVLIHVLLSSLPRLFPFPLIQRDSPLASRLPERCIARRHCEEIDQSLFLLAR